MPVGSAQWTLRRPARSIASSRTSVRIRWESFALGGDAGPIVGPEGGQGEALLAVEVADRVVGPGVADGDRVGDLFRPDLDLVLAHDLRLGLVEPPVARRDGETSRIGDVERLEAAADVVEREDDLVALLLHLFIHRAMVGDVHAVVARQGPAGEPVGD